MPNCPKCGKWVDEGGAFCQNCGAPIQGEMAPAPAAGPAPVYGGAPPPAVPQAYVPAPIVGAPTTMAGPSKRNFSVAGGILTVIAVCLVLVSGVVVAILAIEADYVVDSYWDEWDYEYVYEYARDWPATIYFSVTAALSFVAFGIGMASTIGAFKMKWKIITLLGPIFTIAAGAMGFMTYVGIVAMILAILGLIFIALSISQYQTAPQAPAPPPLP